MFIAGRRRRRRRKVIWCEMRKSQQNPTGIPARTCSLATRTNEKKKKWKKMWHKFVVKKVRRKWSRDGKSCQGLPPLRKKIRFSNFPRFRMRMRALIYVISLDFRFHSTRRLSWVWNFMKTFSFLFLYPDWISQEITIRQSRWQNKIRKEIRRQIQLIFVTWLNKVNIHRNFSTVWGIFPIRLNFEKNNSLSFNIVSICISSSFQRVNISESFEKLRKIE